MSATILAFDTSLGCPGAAVVEVKRKPHILAVSHVKTDSRDSRALRSQTIYAWAHLFIRENLPKGGVFDAVVREDFQGRSSVQNAPVFSAWAAIDRALTDFRLADTSKPISQSQVKKLVAGNGRAEKPEVADAVRKLTGYRGDFATDDESDAAAIALAAAITKGWVKA